MPFCVIHIVNCHNYVIKCHIDKMNYFNIYIRDYNIIINF
jgi:hypothetical protein